MRCAAGVSFLVMSLVCAGAQAAAGDDCISPLVVTLPGGLPFVDLNQHTCGRGNDYDADDTCLGAASDGEDIIYQLEVTTPTGVEITMDPKGQLWTVLVLSSNCPPAGDGCLAYCGDDTAAPRVLPCWYLAPGTYTLMIDCLPTPEQGACIADFDLSITACELPQGACCVNLDCIGTLPQAPCFDAGGAWYPGFECATFACPILIGLPDTCATAYSVATVPFSASLTTNTAAAGPPPGSCNAPGTTVMQNDVWVNYTPAEAGTLTVSVQYEMYEALTAIYAGPDCGGLSELACLYAGGRASLTTVTLDVSAGTTYWFQIGDYGVNPGGGATLLALSNPVTILTGDVNCSGGVGFDDINPFVLLLSNPAAWQATFPGCPVLNGDINGDGTVNFDDINPFVALLSGR